MRIVENAQGLPEQWVDRQHTPALQVVDLSGHPDPAAAAREAMQRDRLSPVDPARVLVCELVPGAFEGVGGAVRRAE